jgi:general secretion pathway protein G
LKKSFTVLEVLFVLVIISILSSFAITNILPLSKDAYITKAKTSIANIRLGIYNYQNLSNQSSSYPNTLDNQTIDIKDVTLFDQVLTYPLISTNNSEKKRTLFSKKSENEYILYLENSEINFVYDNTKGTFNCDYSQELCKKLNQ